MNKPKVVLIDIKNIIASPSYKETKCFLTKAIKESWDNALQSVADETKSNVLKYIIETVAQSLKAHKVKDQSLDSVITTATSAIKSFFYDLPQADLVNYASNYDSEFALDKFSRASWPEVAESKIFEVKLIHVKSSSKFKEGLWQSIISKIQQELNAGVQTYENPSDILAATKETSETYLVTARPKLFSHLLEKEPPLHLIYVNNPFIKIMYKYKQENFITSQKIKLASEITGISQLNGLLDLFDKQKMNPDEIIRVGYNLGVKKLSLIQERGRALTPSYPVLFVPVDLRFGTHRDVEVLLHKYIDFREDKNDMEGHLKMVNLNDMYYKPKGDLKLKLLDPPDSFDITSDRARFEEAFIALLASEEFQAALDEYWKATGNPPMKFQVPQAKRVNPATVIDMNLTVLSLGLQYPLIAKTVVSCTTATSHQMAIALNEDGLHMVEKNEIFKSEEHLLQELINHDGRLFKIYAMGSEIAVEQRQSVPNISSDSLGVTHFFFNSQQSFGELEFFKNKVGFTKIDVDVGAIKILIEFIGKKLNLSLMGIDLIREADTGIYYMIDINYFPGFQKHKDSHIMLKKHIVNTFGKKA